MALELTSTAFAEGEAIPRQYTGDGRDASPPLAWQGAPAGTGGFALVCEDPDAPRGTFTHWVAWNIPAASAGLAEGVPAEGTLADGTVQGRNGFGKAGYGGPAPPPGKPHRYYFKLHALDGPLALKAGATKEELLAAMRGHVLAEGQLMGRYGR
jgi:Raf kinase inhibitor-like YbhB/YbcL family protein